MIVELKENEYNKIKTIVDPIKFHLPISAIIDGGIPGRIWVDNVDNPTSVLIWDKRYAYYLGGDENNEKFNSALNRIFIEEISPNALEKDYELFFIACDKGWEDKLLKEKLLNVRSRTIQRQYHTFNQPKVRNWKERIPSGFNMIQADEDFLKRNDLENFDPFLGEVHDISGSKEDFVKRGNFGSCLVYDDRELVSWCLSFFHGGSCELWIQTVEKYQKQGYATLTAAAFVDFCLDNNIRMGWHSNQNNIASIRLAQKVGFDVVLNNYSWVYGSFTT